MNRLEAIQMYNDMQASGMLASKGVHLLESTRMFLPEEWRYNFELACDAQPSLFTDPNAGVPAFLTTIIDPDIFRVIFAPNKAALIFGEKQKGTWLDQTAMFPVVENTGEVSSYGDYAESGRAGANFMFPQRQSYLFQVIKEYGDLEVARAGLARLNWQSEIDGAATFALSKFQNTTYFFGVAGLQNYGLLNDPNLSAPLTPATKAAGGTKWVNNSVVVATANEIFADIQSLYIKLVQQTGGTIDKSTPMTLALSPQSEMALTATNAFNVNVSDLLKKNFSGLKIETAQQYGATSSSNPQGNTAGELVQLIADNVEGQDVGYVAFSEKSRSHPIVRQLSSWKQKETSGTWGAIIRFPAGISQMVGV